MDIDLGDIVARLTLHVKGHHATRLSWQVSPPAEAQHNTHVHVPARPSSAPHSAQPRKADTTMQLQADKQVTLTVTGTDEMGNQVDVTGITFEADNADVVTVTDNGDGTAVVAATGTPGVATVTARSGGIQGSLAFDVVPGDLTFVEITASDPTEVTPDA
jgi:hypothetical protein